MSTGQPRLAFLILLTIHFITAGCSPVIPVEGPTVPPNPAEAQPPASGATPSRVMTPSSRPHNTPTPDLQIPRSLIGFVNETGGIQSLVVIDDDGEVLRSEVQPTSRMLIAPDWSSDGGTIVYANNQFAEDGQLNCTVEVLDLATLDARVIAGPYNYCNAPSWSPSNDAVVFEADVDFQNPNLGIYLSELATGKTSRLTTFPGSESSPVWSHSGNEIAFASTRDREDGTSGPSVIDVVTGEVRQTSDLTVAGPIKWSSDDLSIYLLANNGPGTELFQVDLQSGDAHALTDNSMRELDFDASTDNATILVVGTEGDSHHLMALSLDGTPLSDYPSEDELTYPLWAPTGDHYLYISGETDGRICIGRLHLEGTRCMFDGGTMSKPHWIATLPSEG